MNLLLDTHVVLWAFANDSRLSGHARDSIVDGRNLVFVSAASAWEIGLKKAMGKLTAPDDFLDQLATHRFTPLDVTCAHGLALEHLPLLHRDPFDRILVAQARMERLTLVTRDPNVLRYDVETMEV